MEEVIVKGLLGRKLGMTQVFTEDGVLIPVTVIEAEPNIVLQVKTVETDGYNAVQLGFEDVRENVRQNLKSDMPKKLALPRNVLSAKSATVTGSSAVRRSKRRHLYCWRNCRRNRHIQR